MRRRILIIVNPAAGRRRSGERRLRAVVAALERRGCIVVLRRSGPPGDVERLAREAEPAFDAVVAAGGDGTVSAVVNGLAGKRQVLGVLPLGTVNLLAREIGLPREPEGLAALIAAAPAQPIWPGRVNGRRFTVMASAGFDSATVAGVDLRLKDRLGRLAFLCAAVACLRRYQPCELTVEADGVEHRAALLIAAKGRFYGGPFVVAPEAKPVDPTIELVLLSRQGRAAILRYATALALGRIPRLKDVTILRIRRAVVSGSLSLPVQADGEIAARLPVTIDVADEPVLVIAGS